MYGGVDLNLASDELDTDSSMEAYFLSETI
jgi:hypothetical protein